MILTSLDGQWIAIRRGREVAMYAASSPEPVGTMSLDDDDAQLAFAGAPAVLVSLQSARRRVQLHVPRELELGASHSVSTSMNLAAVTGPRVALVSDDGMAVTIIKSAGRALAASTIDPGGRIEHAVGLDRGQLLLSVLKKLDVWDLATHRPLLRLQLQLPPAPRRLGAAHGHLWSVRDGGQEVFVYRLSDGRPFRHVVGARIDEVISHPQSRVIVVVTDGGLVRLHCNAHSLTAIETPWKPGTPMALRPHADEVELLGLGPDEPRPWSVPLIGHGSPSVTYDVPEPVAVIAVPPTAPPRAWPADRPAEPRPPLPQTAEPAGVNAPAPATSTGRGSDDPRWRAALAEIGEAIAGGADVDPPDPGPDTSLDELARRFAITGPSLRALSTLYAVYLVGSPPLAIARLARILDGWTEPLGQGALSAHALIRRVGGRVQLRRAVTEFLDGAPPRAIRIVGDGAARPALGPGILRVSRDGRTDDEIGAALARHHGRIAIVDGSYPLGVLEARVRGLRALVRSIAEHRDPLAAVIVIDGL